MVSQTTGARSVVVAVMAGAVAASSYAYFSDDTTTATSEDTQSVEPTTAAELSETTVQPARTAATPFTTADQGACLTWTVADDGSITDFEQTPCDQEHRFEVSAREDLATFPASEFGPEASIPSPTRQAQLREELCGNSTVNYLDGVYDPNGRYSIASILPPAEFWDGGDRTLLCGLQVTDASGSPTLTMGRVADQDQARVLQPGECVAIDPANSLKTVDCAEPHNLEITSVVSLASQFPDHTPSVDEQDKYLADVCTDAAHDYLGGEENLYQISLQPFWTTQSPASWEGGSRSVNCALVFARDGQFAELTGSATEGKQGLRIDGNPPPDRPERRPLRDDTSATPSASAPQPAAEGQ